MHTSPRRARALVVAALVVALAPTVVGCTSSPSGPAPPATGVWFGGDSIGAAASDAMHPHPWTAAVGGAGFTAAAPNSILANTLQRIDMYGLPRVLLVMGGVNDTNRGVSTSDITDGMVTFNQAMVDLGIEVIWVVEPAWQRAAEMDPVNEWLMATYPAIDCRAETGPPSGDGIHPADINLLASCISAAIADRGVTFP